ncbi:MAG: membrane integrity-associated transporter subunit PqiC [Deltaproteobacteria bacterium]|nr:membrane integrity-associated transporter subunit PqiC [Deltaproteobacteria bacterium]
MRHLAAIAIPCALIILMAGCATTPARFYTLSATPGSAATSSNLSVIVGPVSVPATVDRPQMVVNTGANQVRMDEFNLWASPLQNNISRVVAQNLATLLGTPHVTLFPQTLSADAGYRVAIEVQSFDSTLGQAVVLDAVWTIRRTKDGKTEMGRTTVREAVQETDYAALVAAHSRTVARLSQDIADAVRALDRSGQ